MAKKIDPLNRKLYGAVTANLTVSDVKAAANFYQKALWFTKRGIMNGRDRKVIHAELTHNGFQARPRLQHFGDLSGFR